MIDSRKLNQHYIIWVWNKTWKPNRNNHAYLCRIPPKLVRTGKPWQLPSTVRIAQEALLLLFHFMYWLTVKEEAVEEKLAFMTSIEFFMLQVRWCKDQVSPPKHMRFWWRQDHQTPAEKEIGWDPLALALGVVVVPFYVSVHCKSSGAIFLWFIRDRVRTTLWQASQKRNLYFSGS